MKIISPSMSGKEPIKVKTCQYADVHDWSRVWISISIYMIYIQCTPNIKKLKGSLWTKKYIRLYILIYSYS